MTLDNKQDIRKFLLKLGLINPQNPEFNAQFLAHSVGKSGIEFSNIVSSIIDNGLWIANRYNKTKNSNSYVASGLLSTTCLINDDNNALKDYGGPFISTASNCISDEKMSTTASIVIAIPQFFDNFFLGKIHKDRELIKQAKTCILDLLEIENIPPEFILGISYGNALDMEQSKLVVNPKFYALNENNKQNAEKFLSNLFKEKYIPNGLPSSDDKRFKFFKIIYKDVLPLLINDYKSAKKPKDLNEIKTL